VKKGILWLLLTCLMVMSMVLASCGKSTTTSPATSTSTTATTTTSAITTTTTTSTISTAVTTTATTSTTGHWWDSFPAPQYGGETTSRTTSDPVNWDVYLGGSSATGYGFYFQHLFCNKYITNPSEWNFSINFLPPEYADGFMLQSYEMPTPTTFTIHLRQDIYWQNISPANGRQFTSADVVYHYNRLLGLGGGFTAVDPWYAGTVAWQSLASVTATDKYTVVFQWKPGTSPLLILMTLQSSTPDNLFECSDAVTQWGNLNDWHHAIGTGPFILQDFVPGSSETVIRNPNYWGYDERYPQNKLPYVNKTTVLLIASTATAEAALRTGKLDSLSVSAIDAAAIKKTNPEMTQLSFPTSYELSLDMRADNVAPFNDIRVRIAMQKAIDISLISKTYYGGNSTPWPTSLTQNQMGLSGWGLAYPDWPQALKDEYAYDPTAARKLLSDAGYPNGFTTDVVLTSDSDQDLYLLAQSQLAAIGVKMSIVVMDPASWNNYVINNHKYDAMAARNSGLLGITSDPFHQLQKLTAGYGTNYILVNDAKITAWYNQASVSQNVAEIKQIMKDENLYVAQQHYIVSISQPNSFSLRQPWLIGSGGPGGISVYGDVNWVDQNLKKSLGH